MRYVKRQQSKLIEVCTHCFILLCVLFYGFRLSTVKVFNDVQDTKVEVVFDQDDKVDTVPTEQDQISMTLPEPLPEPIPEPTQPLFEHSRDWNENEQYLLAKLVKCEAGNQSTYTKAMVILTVYNRLYDPLFPNTIEDIIFENCNGLWQYSPCMPNGSWWYLEPDDDCYAAVQLVMDMPYDPSEGAEFFESFTTQEAINNSWHAKNLELLFESDDMRFYRP